MTNNDKRSIKKIAVVLIALLSLSLGYIILSIISTDDNKDIESNGRSNKLTSSEKEEISRLKEKNNQLKKEIKDLRNENLSTISSFEGDDKTLKEFFPGVDFITTHPNTAIDNLIHVSMDNLKILLNEFIKIKESFDNYLGLKFISIVQETSNIYLMEENRKNEEDLNLLEEQISFETNYEISFKSEIDDIIASIDETENEMEEKQIEIENLKKEISKKDTELAMTNQDDYFNISNFMFKNYEINSSSLNNLAVDNLLIDEKYKILDLQDEYFIENNI